MRKDARNYENPEIRELSGYHGGHFENLKAFNSDRVINLNRNYTVSDDNTKSTKSIVKVGSRLALIGLEIETVSPIINVGSTVLVNVLELTMNKAGFPSDFFKIEADCTVDAECITQTFTRSWLRNNYKSFKAMYECFSKLNITTDSSRCGMHVNLDLTNFGKSTETQIENVRKLGYLINKHYDLFKVAFYRNGLTRWCPRMVDTKEYWKNTDIYDFPVGHDKCCINMGHIGQNRVEIRLVGGQKNYACFRNTLETVIHVIDAVKKLSWNDLDDLTKVFKGCNRYVFDRLSTNCLRANVIDLATIETIRATVSREFECL